MVYQPPSGARDLLPLDVAQKHWIEERLEQVFQRWSYQRIITSTVESLETLMAGGAIDQTTVIELQGTSTQRLGLRPELTASIARTAVTRMARVSYPQRLYYVANVFRRAAQGSHGQQQELYQAGVELLGTGGGLADAEMLLLVIDSLRHLGLARWHLVLGNAGLTQSLLAPFPQEHRAAVRCAIAHLDRVTLEILPLEADLRQRALQLMDLRGRPEDVLQTVSGLDLSAEQRHMVEGLKTLVELLQEATAQRATATMPSLVLDLSLIETFDYYTGLVFEVVSDTAARQVLGKGGRYDNLLGVFHPEDISYPGIGFMLSIEALHQVLMPSGQLPQTTAASDWLVVPLQPSAAAAAFAYAQTIREATNLVRVEVYLEALSAKDPPAAETVRMIAKQRQIDRIAWIGPDGLPEIETLP
ncbi:Histidine--tRNA ligase [Halomicronema hongdechloris C2206]|uniref:ATP phosphoribosyltransferase regulatory subunit n=1 Tax=Halomicronema hongdechloris C2206 TaxID=1641165 RepID=A0A1Z3HMU2_9CYAN|nr:ATP phosphoribosyltransferase regulatory subunit [Halomicronema hongdechloris]ASC71595.1 Histidine--tRNA ligase [Halomicronema hongdechloris C2206]